MSVDQPATRETITIVGAGFSGTLLAINLLREPGQRVVLVERRDRTGRGVAYSTVHPEHLLNVRVAGMSALADDPDHFARWLSARGGGASSGFVPRRLYGRYLDDLLADAVADAGDRITLVQGDAVDIEPGDAASRLRLADGRAIEAGTVALALGNLPPLAPPGIDVATLPPGCYVDDPWGAPFAEGLSPRDRVVVLGTGLTLVDVALLLDAEGFAGELVAVSRRGLVPRSHRADVPATTLPERPAPTALALLAAMRRRARVVPWRAAVDELRPHTQRIWGAMHVAERARFLRHVRPWWDVHRHRIAPEVAARLDAMIAGGRLRIVAGRLLSAERAGDGARVTWRERGSGIERTVAARRIVNATGPQGDLTRSRDPLLRALHGRGLIRPDPLRIGLDVDQQSRAIADDGSASDRLLVLGPMTRGAFWEIVAVPDIRRQVWSVARRLTNAQWVEGEGL
jgi:uncharacterized NAD(P)/FAD-binding protein YdhS